MQPAPWKRARSVTLVARTAGRRRCDVVAAVSRSSRRGLALRRRAAPVPWNIRSASTAANEATLEYKPEQLAVGSWACHGGRCFAALLPLIDAAALSFDGFPRTTMLTASRLLLATAARSTVGAARALIGSAPKRSIVEKEKGESADTRIAAFPAVCATWKPPRHVPPMPGDLCTCPCAAGMYSLRTPSGLLCASSVIRVK